MREIEDVLAELCEHLRVSVTGLARAMAPDDGTRRRELADGETIRSMIDVIFDVDTSNLNTLELIVKVASWPLWKVHVYWADADGVKVHAGTMIVRAAHSEFAIAEAIEGLRNDQADGWTGDAIAIDEDDAVKISDTKPSGSDQAAMSPPTARIVQALQENARIRTALQQIVQWDGFPVIPEYASSDPKHSYMLAFGSNGERDFMRGIARKALEPIKE